MRKLIILGLPLSILVLNVTLGWAFSNAEATIAWTPTMDSTIRYELRWQHYLNGWQWQTVITNLDSTSGSYRHVFPTPFTDSTGDRGVCWDARAVQNGLSSQWTSELGTHACTQVPLAVVPPPPPPPSGLSISSATPDQVVITASVKDCARVITSTKGSTSTTLKRTVTCVK